MRAAVLPLILGLLVGCVSAPVQEMSDARQALRAAQAAGAADYAPEPLAEAQRLVDLAQQELQQHDYRSAQRAALEARRSALVALEQARAARAAQQAPPAPQP